MTRYKNSMSHVEAAQSQQLRWLILAIAAGLPAAISGAVLLIAWVDTGNDGPTLHSLNLSISSFIITLAIFIVSAPTVAVSCWMGSRWEKEEIRQERLQREQQRDERRKVAEQREKRYGIY